MLLKEQLESTYFSPAEQIAVDYILKFPDKIENKTIQVVASETYTQPSALVRIAKKMGFKGWRDFKKAYLEEWEYINKNFQMVDANLPFHKSDDVMTIAGKIATLEKSTIDDLYSLLRSENLQQARKMLLEAGYIRIFAQNANLLVANDFALKMNRIGKNVVLSSIKGEEGYEANNMPKDSCGIIISYSGENTSLIQVNTILKRKCVPTICITSIGENTLSSQSTCPLPITTREKLYSKVGHFTTNISIIYLLDVLYSMVFAENFDKNFAHLKRVGEEIDTRSEHSSILS